MFLFSFYMFQLFVISSSRTMKWVIDKFKSLELLLTIQSTVRFHFLRMLVIERLQKRNKKEIE